MNGNKHLPSVPSLQSKVLRCFALLASLGGARALTTRALESFRIPCSTYSYHKLQLHGYVVKLAAHNNNDHGTTALGRFLG